MDLTLRLQPDLRPGLSHIPKIIVVVIIIATVTHWMPAAAVPLVAGLAVGCWLLAGSLNPRRA